MSSVIAPVFGLGHVSGAQPPDEKTAKLRKAAGEFESILVRQLLKEAKLTGSEKSNGYGDMAIDALASAVESGGGLGLSHHIERMLASHVGLAQEATPPPGGVRSK